MNNVIVDDIGAVVAAMRETGSNEPYYMYGHRLEVSNRLREKDLDMVYKYQKYPLVVLRLDVPEERNAGMIDYSLNLAILNPTELKWNAEERYTNVFKPILIPLYELFIDKLKESGLFMWGLNLNDPKHDKIDRPFHGIAGPEGNVKYIFGDNLDCIEILGLEVKQRIKHC